MVRKNLRFAGEILNGVPQMTVQIYADPSVKTRSVGLCGDWNGDSKNDWEDINGKNLDLQKFVASWPAKAVTSILMLAIDLKPHLNYYFF